MNPGDTIIGLDFGNHFWIVISAPTDEGEIALVNLTTHGRGVSCGLHCTTVARGEHPYVIRESCVYFRGAYLNAVAPLTRAREQGTLRQHEAVAPDLLRRIQEAALVDRMVPRAVKMAVQNSLEP